MHCPVGILEVVGSILESSQIFFVVFGSLSGKNIGRHIAINYSNGYQGPVAQSVECLFRGTGGHGFDPGPQHTKVVKNGTTYEPPHDKTNKMTAPNEDSDQPGHPPSLISLRRALSG